MQLALRLPVWTEIRLSKVTEAALDNRADILRSCSLSTDLPPITETELDPLIKVHVDFLDEESHARYRSKMMTTVGRPGDYYYDIGDDRWNDFKCKHRHDTSVCKCHLPVYHIGQDEAVFKQYALPSKSWRVDGKIKLRPKSEGQGVMVSALVDEWRGFGLPMTSAEIDLVNNVREREASRTGSTPRAKIKEGESPGLIFFQYGNGRGKEGYWEQCADFMDVIEILYPDMQILLEVDHSSGHLKEQSDGLMVNAMDLRWGWQTVPKRDSLIEEGCLGETPPTINGRQLTLGMMQKMIFEEGDPPPFNDPKALPHDTPMNQTQMAKELESRKRKTKSLPGRDEDVDGALQSQELNAPYVVHGYVGKNKGILQVRQSAASLLPSYPYSNVVIFVTDPV